MRYFQVSLKAIRPASLGCDTLRSKQRRASVGALDYRVKWMYVPLNVSVTTLGCLGSKARCERPQR